MIFGIPAFRPIWEVLRTSARAVLGKTYPLHHHERYAPFFVMGAGRSGTTLLRRILQASPEIHIPPETYVLGQVIPSYRRRMTSAWHDLVYLVLAAFEYHPLFYTFEVTLRPLASQLLQAPEGRRSLAFILDSLYTFHGRETGQQFHRWGDKTPINTFCLNEIHAVFPDAKYVHLVRDGVDVVASMMASGTSPSLSSVAGAAERWCASVQAACRFARRHPSACLEIRYEELVKDSEETVRKVCHFLGIQFESRMIHARDHTQRMGDVMMHPHHAGVLKRISTESIGKGRASLAPEQKAQLGRLIGRELADLGYAPV